MKYFDEFIEEVDKGRRGENLTLSSGMPKYDTIVGGVGNATYTLVGANLGIGKTAFVDSAYVLTPYHLTTKGETDISIRIFYYSFEIAKKKKIAKWICYLIFWKTGMILDVKEIYSRRSKLTDDKYQLINQFRDYIDKMEDRVHIFDRPTNPTGLYMDLKKYALASGKEEEITKTLENGHEIKYRQYKPNNPKEIVMYIEDHIGLARAEKDLRTKKERIDKGSEYAVELRNHYGISKVAVSQFNREIADVDRRRFSELTPQLEDFKDTGNASEDADIVIALFNPLRYNIAVYGAGKDKEGNTVGGINVVKLGGRYRNVIILKNRDGTDMIKHNLNFLGEVGHFREFPDPFNDDDYELGKQYKPWKIQT